MSFHRSIFLLLLVLSGSLLFGCSSTSVLETGANTIVRYRQIDKKTGKITLELIMVEKNNQAYRDLYSKERKDANIKKVPVERLKSFLRVLDDLGYLDMACPLPKGTAPCYSGVSKALIVENDSGQWVAMNRSNLTLDQYKRFQEMVQHFRNYYDTTFSLQAIQNEEGQNLFLEEQRRLQERSRGNPVKEQ